MGLDACVIPKGDIFLNARVNNENLWKHILKNVKKKLKVLLIRHFTPEQAYPWGRFTYNNDHKFKSFPAFNGK